MMYNAYSETATNNIEFHIYVKGIRDILQKVEEELGYEMHHIRLWGVVYDVDKKEEIESLGTYNQWINRDEFINNDNKYFTMRDGVEGYAVKYKVQFMYGGNMQKEYELEAAIGYEKMQSIEAVETIYLDIVGYTEGKPADGSGGNGGDDEETGGIISGILGAFSGIIDFFTNILEWVGNIVKFIIIPSDEFMNDWINGIKETFSGENSAFGMFIGIIERLKEIFEWYADEEWANDPQYGWADLNKYDFLIPELKFMDQVLIPEKGFSIRAIYEQDENIKQFREYGLIFTSLTQCFFFIGYLRKKINEVLNR